jgi:hypothetical protein
MSDLTSLTHIDIGPFMRSWERIKNIDLPTAIVKGLRDTAQRARNAVADRTRKVFKLHTDYIPNAIWFIPDRDNQVAAAIKAAKGKYGDFVAAVFVRKATDKRFDLSFMTVHETGGERSGHTDKSTDRGSIAVPLPGLTRLDYRTARGAVRLRHQPAVLLREYSMSGPRRKRQKGRRSTPNAFVIKSKIGDGYIIVKRRFKNQRLPLDVLYKFMPSVSIKRRWGFVDTVTTSALAHMTADIVRSINNAQTTKG